MARQKSNKTPPESEVLARVRSLFETVWHANQLRMATEIGISQPTLSRVLSGRRPVGRAVLLGLASHPKVNQEWLLHGHGAALSTDECASRPGFLPVFRQLLTGRLRDCPDRIPESYFPVAEPFFRLSCYWLELAREHCDALGPDSALRPGDLLLLETRDAAAEIAGKIVVLRDRHTRTVRLIRKDEFTTTENVVSDKIKDDDFVARFGLGPRKLQLEGSPALEQRLASKETQTAIPLDQEVIAVAQQVWRRSP